MPAKDWRKIKFKQREALSALCHAAVTQYGLIELEPDERKFPGEVAPSVYDDEFCCKAAEGVNVVRRDILKSRGKTPAKKSKN